ncbi:hypothetical protein STEPF1_06175 [Streptomyces sp. F-1]|nr:hypothetical protein STEPF1_06175 [Streptomyces sp. F-1]
MKTTEHAELIRRFADDFTAMQEAALSQTNGACAPETATALKDTSLVGPVTSFSPTPTTSPAEPYGVRNSRCSLPTGCDGCATRRGPFRDWCGTGPAHG